MDKHPEIKVNRKSGREVFHTDGIPLPLSLLSFWQWYASDIVNNAMRGILAEYIVATAVSNPDGYRVEWDAYDIDTTQGVKVEVKSAAYLQSWSQKNLSSINFSIRPTLDQNPTDSPHAQRLERQSDVYVFCLLRHKNQETLDPLNLSQWIFYVITTKDLNRLVGKQKTISLSKLENLNPLIVPYTGISEAIKQTTII